MRVPDDAVDPTRGPGPRRAAHPVGEDRGAGRSGTEQQPVGEQLPKVGISAGIIQDKYRFFPIPSAALATNPELDQSAP